jgi:hypothetical protein
MIVINSNELIVSNGSSFIELITSIVRKFNTSIQTRPQVLDDLVLPIFVKFSFQDNVKEYLRTKLEELALMLESMH